MSADLLPAPATPRWAPAPAPQASRLEQLTAAWLARRSPHTQREYRKDLRYWLTWCDRCGITPLDATMMHVDAWIAWQREHGPAGDGRRAAETSIARRVATISSWYKYLIRNTAGDPVPLATANPASTDGRPNISPDDSATTGLSAAEADKLIRAADADSIRSSALIRLLLYTGLRCGSALSAKVTDLGHDRGHRVLDVTMKGGKHRRVPLPASLAETIDAMLAQRDTDSEWLFATRAGKPMDEAMVFRLVRRLARKAGIESWAKLSPHSLRHTFATSALDAGVALSAVQDAMGHADPRTTRRYDRARYNLDKHPAYVLATRFGGRREEPSPAP